MVWVKLFLRFWDWYIVYEYWIRNLFWVNSNQILNITQICLGDFKSVYKISGAKKPRAKTILYTVYKFTLQAHMDIDSSYIVHNKNTFK